MLNEISFELSYIRFCGTLLQFEDRINEIENKI